MDVAVDLKNHRESKTRERKGVAEMTYQGPVKPGGSGSLLAVGRDLGEFVPVSNAGSLGAVLDGSGVGPMGLAKIFRSK